MESRRNGTDEPICRAGIETQRTDLWKGRRGGEDGTDRERSTDVYIHYCVLNR